MQVKYLLLIVVATLGIWALDTHLYIWMDTARSVAIIFYPFSMKNAELEESTCQIKHLLLQSPQVTTPNNKQIRTKIISFAKSISPSPNRFAARPG